MEYINIQPKDFTQTTTKINIKVIYLELNTYAIIGVKLFDVNSKLLDGYEFTLEGDDYSNWHTDNYLFNYVCQKYNLSLPTI